MAISPAHKFGQIVGGMLEEAINPFLESFSREHGLYLDRKGRRPARSGTKVRWTDVYGNRHDLDFVLERGGSPDHIGTPVAFIETAWRRYTKHSRNKAQEIQGAIQPLAATYKNAAPFIGVILAGVFTEGAIKQLQSLGFAVLYFPYETIVKAFGRVGISAKFDEVTPDAESARRVRAWRALSAGKRRSVAVALVKLNDGRIQSFLDALRKSATRQIEQIYVLPLHGASARIATIEEAIQYVERYDEGRPENRLVRYEVRIVYSNGDRIEGQFKDKESAIAFLQGYRAPQLHSVPARR